MEESKAIDALSALGQAARLKVFKLLVRFGPGGLAAGRIAEELGVPPNTLSTNLTILSQAGLIGSRRNGRSIVYSVNLEQLRALVTYLIRDCCQGSPELCAPLRDLLTEQACYDLADPACCDEK